MLGWPAIHHHASVRCLLVMGLLLMVDHIRRKSSPRLQSHWLHAHAVFGHHRLLLLITGGLCAEAGRVVWMMHSGPHGLLRAVVGGWRSSSIHHRLRMRWHHVIGWRSSTMLHCRDGHSHGPHLVVEWAHRPTPSRWEHGHLRDPHVHGMAIGFWTAEGRGHVGAEGLLDLLELG